MEIDLHQAKIIIIGRNLTLFRKWSFHCIRFVDNEDLLLCTSLAQNCSYPPQWVKT